jgi:hypothetical protein
MYITRWHGYQVRMSMNHIYDYAGDGVQTFVVLTIHDFKGWR